MRKPREPAAKWLSGESWNGNRARLKTCRPNPTGERTINKPVNALLLEMAQAMDEIASPADEGFVEDAEHRKTVWRLSVLAREGAEWVVSVPPSRGHRKVGAPKQPKKSPSGSATPA